jgi:hypothetical protein
MPSAALELSFPAAAKPALKPSSRTAVLMTVSRKVASWATFILFSFNHLFQHTGVSPEDNISHDISYVKSKDISFIAV